MRRLCERLENLLDGAILRKTLLCDFSDLDRHRRLVQALFQTLLRDKEVCDLPFQASLSEVNGGNLHVKRVQDPGGGGGTKRVSQHQIHNGGRGGGANGSCFYFKKCKVHNFVLVVQT